MKIIRKAIPFLWSVAVVGGMIFWVGRMIPVSTFEIKSPSSATAPSYQGESPPSAVKVSVETKKRSVKGSVNKEAAPAAFEDIAAASGITFTHVQAADAIDSIKDVIGSGVCFIDYNRDGYADLYFVNGSGFNHYHGRQPWWYQGTLPTSVLYRNNKDGTFTDVAQQAGVGAQGWGMGCAVADYDNDGHPDLFVTNYGPNILYRNNGDGTFSDATEKTLPSEKDPERWSTGAVWGDYDNDGLLDLYVLGYLKFDKKMRAFESNKAYAEPMSSLFESKLYNSQSNILYRNNGDGTFSDLTAAAGVADSAGKGMSAVFTDYNGDRFLDLYIVNDGPRNVLFLNERNGTFSEVGGEVGVDTPQRGMGATAGDYDNDGGVDLFSTYRAGYTNILYRNASQGASRRVNVRESKLFEDVGADVGLAENSGFGYFSWGAEFFDFDNDGFLDLFVANGYPAPEFENPKRTIGQKNQLFSNTGDGRFTEVSDRLGRGLQLVKSGRGVAVGDLDNDGRLEIVINNNNDQATVLQNGTGNANRWVTITLIGVKSNRDGFGAKIDLRAGSLHKVWETRSGASYLSQSDGRPHFGLGEAEKIDSLIIEWPSGLIQRFQDLETDRFITIREGDAEVDIAPARPAMKPPPAVQTASASKTAKPMPMTKAPTDRDRWMMEVVRGVGILNEPRAIPHLVKLLQHKTPEVRREAVVALSRMTDEKGYAPLMKMVNDGDPGVRREALRALPKFQNDQAVEAAVAALEDRDKAVRSEAAKTIGLFLKAEQTIRRATIYRKMEAVVPLLRVFKDPSADVRKEAVAALGFSENYRAVIPSMEMLKDRDRDVRRQAALTLGLLRDRRGIEPLLRVVENSQEEPTVRSAAVLSLVRLASKVTIEPLIAGLAKEDRAAKRQALATLKVLLEEKESVLVKRGPLEVPLFETLKEHDEEIRLETIRTLALIKTPEVVSRLVTLLGDQSEPVRRETIGALASIKDNRAVDHLLPLLSDKSDQLRRKEVLAALGHFSSRSAVFPLLAVATDPSEKVDIRVTALASLARVAPGVVINHPQLLSEQKHEIRCEIIKAITGFPDHHKREFLLANLSAEMPAEVKTEAIIALGKVKEKRSVERLIDLIKNRDEPNHVKSRAIETLGLIGDDRVVVHLKSIAENKSDPHRVDAVNALGGFRDDQVMKFLLKVAKDTKEGLAIRSAAFSALGDGNKEALVQLLTWTS